MTLMERTTSCIVGWAVAASGDEMHWQAVLDAAPQAVLYFSEAMPSYLALLHHPRIHIALPNKCQTYRVDADTAVLRPYLSRLARRSLCFSRSLTALWQAVKVLVYAWNRRQLYRHTFP